MWPWEHAIVGYVVYSLFSHLVYRDAPSGLEAFAVVFASVLPDLIDKPLAWQFDIFESGYALGHSVFFAVPLAIVVGALARSVGRSRAGLAFGLGYLIHLPSDILDTYVRGDELRYDIVLWPVHPVEPIGEHTDFFGEFTRLFGRYQQELLAGDLSTYMWFQFSIAVFAALLWLYDGAPVLREFLRGCLRVLSSGR